MEQNKTGKYLKYAIGEIVLVVIGILIALSINNWNEQRKNRVILKSNLLNIVENLKNSTNHLEELKTIREESRANSSMIIDKYRANISISPEEYIHAHMLIAIERKFEVDQSGIEQFKNSRLYEAKELKAIRDQIVSFNQKFKEIEFYESRLNTSTEKLEGEMWEKGFYDKSWPYFRSLVDIPTPIASRSDVDFLKLIKEYGAVKGFFMRAEYSMISIISKYDEFITISDRLSEEIGNYINTYLD